jgi:hypothetical protein
VSTVTTHGNNPKNIDGTGVWFRISPRYEFSESWGFKLFVDYRGTFRLDTKRYDSYDVGGSNIGGADRPPSQFATFDEVSDTPYNRQYHAIILGGGVVFKF